MKSQIQIVTAKPSRRIVLKLAVAVPVACLAVAVVQSTLWRSVPVRVEVLPLGATVTAPDPATNTTIYTTIYAARVSNASNNPIEVVGIQDGCYDTYCLRAHDGFPARLAPGRSADFRIELLVREAGPFTVTTNLWISTDVVVGVPVTLRGIAPRPARAAVPAE